MARGFLIPADGKQKDERIKAELTFLRSLLEAMERDER
jgi:hypothetical protein